MLAGVAMFSLLASAPYRIDDVNIVAASSVHEPSGLVRSRRHPAIYWSHGDYGEPANIVALSASGALVKSYPVADATNVDWEAITIDDDGFLYVADFGNNHEDRPFFTIYQIREPDPSMSAAKAEAVREIRFDYPDRPRPGPLRNINFDAEALFYWDDHLYVLSKHRTDTKTTLYRVPDASGDRVVRLERMGEFDVGGADRPYGGKVTSADVDSKTGRLAILTYHALFVFETKRSDSPLAHLVLRADLDQSKFKQCEGLAWADKGLLILNEDGDLFHLSFESSHGSQASGRPNSDMLKVLDTVKSIGASRPKHWSSSSASGSAAN